MHHSSHVRTVNAFVWSNYWNIIIVISVYRVLWKISMLCKKLHKLGGQPWLHYACIRALTKEHSFSLIMVTKLTSDASHGLITYYVVWSLQCQATWLGDCFVWHVHCHLSLMLSDSYQVLICTANWTQYTPIRPPNVQFSPSITVLVVIQLCQQA